MKDFVEKIFLRHLEFCYYFHSVTYSTSRISGRPNACERLGREFESRQVRPLSAGLTNLPTTP